MTFSGTSSSLVATRVLPQTATTTLSTWASLNTEVTGAHRLAWRGAGPFLVVLSVDGAVVASTPSDVTGQRGVDLTFAGGGGATVRFSEGQRGATLQLRVSGQANRDVTLAPGVMPLPKFRVP